jgi:hypothetical protein
MESKERRNFPGMNIKDIKGLTVPFVFNNGLNYIPTTDYSYSIKTQPEGFFLLPIVAGVVQVQLFDQADDESYLITAAEVTAYTGVALPYRVKKVIAAGTTVTSIKIVW